MEEAFQLVSPEDLQSWLKSFGEAERRKGHALFTNGKVQDLDGLGEGRAFSGFVRDTQWKFQTEIRWEQEWEGDCACGGGHCAHQFALASAVLAEHRTTVVRQLSGSLARTLQGATTPASPESFPPENLESQLSAKLGRVLRSDERSFVRKLRQVYEQSRTYKQLATWSLYEIGLQLQPTYPARDIWPSFPKTELEFWLYIAYALKEQRKDIPEFMVPLTNLEVIEQRMKTWRRSQDIQQWKSTLGNAQVQAPAAIDSAPTETDLRISLNEREIRLQWRPPDRADFVDCKDGDYRRLSAGHLEGAVRFTTEGEIIWHLFDHVACSARIDYEAEPQEFSMLRQLLRMPLLASRIVSKSGQPVERIIEPLRWQVTAPEKEDGDYELALVRADGSPSPRFLAVLPGNPTLYLSPEAVVPGPEMPQFLDHSPSTTIPAPAIESKVGLAFLQGLGVEMPERLKSRVQILPLSARISCELRSPKFDYGPEQCYFDIRAEAQDGYSLAWNGYHWNEQKRKRSAVERKGDTKITLYDNAILAKVRALLHPLNLKIDYGELALRVTRKFPELFSGWLKSLPPDIKVELQGELASFMDQDVAGSVKLDVTEVDIDWFDLRVVLDVADATLTKEEIQLLLKAKGRYVRLEGKGWRRLKFNLDSEEDEGLARLGLSARELSDEPQRLHALQLADPGAKKFLPAEQVQQVQRRAEELKARVVPDLPQGVLAQLRPYQLEGFHFLAYLATNRFGGILADDMGLGKTLQTLAWLLWLRQEAAGTHPPTNGNGDSARDLPSLVVCPKSVMDNWHAEVGKFTPGLRVRCWRPSELSRFADEGDSADLHVVNYSQLRTLGEKLPPMRWLAVILDEGQYIKNPNSQTAQIARALHARHRLILTGTPIENRLLDLWSLMSFAMPGVLSNRAQFGRLYDDKDDPFARRRLAARVRPFVLRRTKGQVAKDLPDRIEEELFCEIEGEQSVLYRAELKRAQQLLLGVKTQQELAQQQFHFLTSLLRLRQICCHPKLIDEESKASSAKTDALLEHLEPLMEEGEKVLVFSQFVQMLDLLRPALEERGWPVFYLAGHTENRGQLVKDFHSADGPAVFLISLKAGGFGLNLTAANYVVLFDPWWNPAVENQAIDRTHRIGQTEKVIAYRLLIKDSIEEKIRLLQKQKKALAEDVLGEEKFSQSLTLEDLRFLFAD